MAAVAYPPSAQRHLALLGELAGIAKQVEQDLPQTHGGIAAPWREELSQRPEKSPHSQHGDVIERERRAVEVRQAQFCDRRHGAFRSDAFRVAASQLVGRKEMVTIRNAGIAALAFVLLGFPSAAFAGFKPSAALQSACRGDA